METKDFLVAVMIGFLVAKVCCADKCNEKPKPKLPPPPTRPKCKCIYYGFSN